MFGKPRCVCEKAGVPGAGQAWAQILSLLFTGIMTLSLIFRVAWMEEKEEG